jgi:small redox-active disulfide protein 2
MADEEITQIMVGKHRTGIVGLKAVLEEISKTFADKSDDEVQAELLKQLEVKNYVPNPVVYGEAFLREFRKFIGKPISETAPEGISVRILGLGCNQCETLYKDVINVLDEMKLQADVEHVKDIKEIGKFGVMGMPGLVINNKVVSVGNIPPKSKIKSWLTEFIKGVVVFC